MYCTTVELWPDRNPLPAPPWPDLSIRRFVEVPLPIACTVRLDMRVIVPHGWLETAAGASPGTEEWRRDGVVRVRRWLRPVAVELVLTAWSATRTEVRLQLGSGVTSLQLPPRYFDVVHAVTDEISAAIEAQSPTTPRARRHLRLIRNTG